MRILHVIIKSEGGGAEKTVQELHAELLHLGIDSKIVCIDPTKNQLTSNFNTDTILNSSMKKGFIRIILSAIALKKLLKEFKPEVLQVNCESPELVVALTPWKKYCRYLVVTEHNSNPWKQAPTLGLIIRRISSIRKANFTSCAQFKSSKYFNSLQSVVIPNLQRNIESLPVIEVSHDISGIFIAQRLFPVKRILNLFEILGNLKFILPIVVCGDGPEFSRLQESATKNGLRVEFKGNVTNPWIYYQKGYLYISCSENEGNPLSVTEATLCRAPMLLSKIQTHLYAVTNEFQTFITFDDLEFKLNELVRGNISLEFFRNDQEFTDTFKSHYSTANIISQWKSFYASL
jgi:glycosyltransferase involved in cell wall biosynthesis